MLELVGTPQKPVISCQGSYQSLSVRLYEDIEKVATYWHLLKSHVITIAKIIYFMETNYFLKLPPSWIKSALFIV